MLRIFNQVKIVFFRERQLKSAGGIFSIKDFKKVLIVVEIKTAIKDDSSK